jgi:hypothetical protein
MPMTAGRARGLEAIRVIFPLEVCRKRIKVRDMENATHLDLLIPAV